MNKTFLVVVSLGFVVAGCAWQAAEPLPCAELTSLSIADTTVASAEVVPAGSFEAPPSNFELPSDYSKLPAFCRVTGSIAPTPDSDIRFELWLPAENWNGKFMQTGNGGAAGSMFYFTMGMPLSRGYAVANTDTGHRGGGGDFSWAVGEAEKLVDFQHRAVHELTSVGKAITAAHYARAPEKSYFDGCSTVGRQGLKEAQRYPGDYDAIIAGAPANNWLALLGFSVLVENNLGAGGLGLDKLDVLKEAAIAACDANDDVTDRVISNPGECTFDPAELQCENGEPANCLSAVEVEAAKRLYAGLVSRDGKVLFPGTGPASEPEWGAFAFPDFRIGSSWYRHVVMRDPDWDPATFDADRDLALAEQRDAGATIAMDPDLSDFIARGGKLILYHGTTDGLIPYGNSVNYYESLIETVGESAVADSVRFYLVPGMGHCAGGPGPNSFDMLTALENWVEKGVAPDKIIATHSTAGKVNRTRPLCPYPQVARFTGKGSIDEAASFACVNPESSSSRRTLQ